MTIKLFISYRSTDSAKVDTIVARLVSLKKEDGTLRYIPWQDKYGIHAGKDWWEAIVEAIIDCQIFVFNISEEALGFSRLKQRPRRCRIKGQATR